MTPEAWLRDLNTEVYKPASPPLRVSSGPLSPEDEAFVIRPEYQGRVYVMVRRLPDQVGDRWTAGGPRLITSRFDLILEQRQPETLRGPMSREAITDLYEYIFFRFPRSVSEISPGIPVTAPGVEYVGGLGRPETKPDDTKRLIAGLSYTAPWISPH